MDQKIVTIFGFPPLKEEFYGWQLSFHHKLDLNNALLYRGNGQIIDLKTQIPIVQNVIEFIELEDLPISITSNEQNMIYVGTNSAVYEIDLRLEKVKKVEFIQTRKTPGFARLCSQSRFWFVGDPRLFCEIRFV